MAFSGLGAIEVILSIPLLMSFISQGAAMGAVLTALLEDPSKFSEFLVDGKAPHPQLYIKLHLHITSFPDALIIDPYASVQQDSYPLSRSQPQSYLLLQAFRHRHFTYVA